MAELFMSSLQSQPFFARTAVKLLHIQPSVTVEKGAEILCLYQGIEELTPQVATNLPKDCNPLHAPFNTLQLRILLLDLASAFYGPVVFLPDLSLLCCIEHLHLSNGWVTRHGLYIGLQKLQHVTHLSFPVQPPRQWNTHTEILIYILDTFHSLQVIVPWCIYQQSSTIYKVLKKWDLKDPRIEYDALLYYSWRRVRQESLCRYLHECNRCSSQATMLCFSCSTV